MNIIKLVFSVFLIAAFSNLLTAQSQLVIQLSATNDGEEQFESLLEQFEKGAEFRLNSVIRDMQQSCELTEEQIRKLKVAAKGAVGKVVDKERDEKLKLLRRYQQQAGFEVDENGVVENEDEDAPVNIRNMGFVLRFNSSSTIENSDLWERSIDKVLTEEQTKSLAEAHTERAAFLRKTAIDLFVARVDLALLLDDEQRTKLREAIENDDLADNLVDEIRFADLNRNRGIRTFANTPEPEYEHLVKGILDEAQIGEWNRTFEPQLLNLKTLRRR